ncbi:MAG: AAA family ATPase [Fusobacterium ulcerans]|uniref:AAA family ATPase n=1 Tax=Fusobacterium ulcerans TaxID=861 RepID=UPI003A8703E5
MELSAGQLSRIDISGYKSIKKCSIKLNKINVLIGSNGAGKSNFISAFALLQNILGKNLQVSVAQRGLNSLFYNGRKVTDEISFEVFFWNNSYGFDLIPTDDNRIIFKKEYFGYHGQWENESTVSKGHIESLWEIGSNNKLDDYIKPILSKQNWRVYHFHDTGKSAKVKQEHNISNNKVLSYDAGNLAAFLYRLKNNYEKNYNEIVGTIQLIAPYFKDFILEPQESNNELIILKWQQRGCDDIFNASQFSDGTLRFICLAALLLQPPELQPATIVVDEPELGLHPYAITIFSEMVKQLPDEKQIIISTQSVELLNEFDVEDVIVVNRSEEGSIFKRLDINGLEAWLESDYALGDLWKKNILGGRLSK